MLERQLSIKTMLKFNLITENATLFKIYLLLDKIDFDIVSRGFSACLSVQIELLHKEFDRPSPSFTFLNKKTLYTCSRKKRQNCCELFHILTPRILLP